MRVDIMFLRVSAACYRQPPGPKHYTSHSILISRVFSVCFSSLPMLMCAFATLPTPGSIAIRRVCWLNFSLFGPSVRSHPATGCNAASAVGGHWGRVRLRAPCGAGALRSLYLLCLHSVFYVFVSGTDLNCYSSSSCSPNAGDIKTLVSAGVIQKCNKILPVTSRTPLTCFANCSRRRSNTEFGS